MSRYNRTLRATNDTDKYKRVLEKRGVTKIEQYRTTTLKHYDTEQVPYIEIIYRDGDSFWKISSRHFGSPEHWYIIARFNNMPSEANLSVGDKIKIPVSLSLALQVVV